MVGAADGSAGVSKEALKQFLVQLVRMRGQLQTQMLKAERPYLMHEGVPGATISRQIAEVCTRHMHPPNPILLTLTAAFHSAVMMLILSC